LNVKGSYQKNLKCQCIIVARLLGWKKGCCNHIQVSACKLFFPHRTTTNIVGTPHLNYWWPYKQGILLTILQQGNQQLLQPPHPLSSSFQCKTKWIKNLKIKWKRELRFKVKPTHFAWWLQINLLHHIKNFTNLQIQMSNPNVLLFHIKCQMFYAIDDYWIIFNTQQNLVVFKCIKLEPRIQVCVQFIYLPLAHFCCCHKITNQNVM
jgi:hypothetical protein